MTTTTVTDSTSAPSIPRLDRRIGLSILGLLTVVGVVAGVARLLAGLGSTTNLTDGYPWGIWIGFDFTLIAFAGTGFTMALVAHVLHRHRYHDAVRPAILAGLLGYVAVLLLLVLDLGRPDRFYHFIIFWNVHSPLFEISWCVLLYTTVLFIETSPYVLERLGLQRMLGLVRKIMVPVAILGVTLSSLHQSTLGTLYLNMPHRLHALWYTPILPLLFFVSAVLAGLSLAILAYMLATAITDRPTKMEIVEGLGRGVLWVAGLYLVLKLGEIVLAGELPALLALDSASLLMWLELGAGIIAPMVMLGVPSLRHKRWAQVGAPLLVLFGVLLNRFNATMFAQILPEGVTYEPHLLEWLSTIGVLAAAALAWYIGVRMLAFFERK
jgi:Ni/Fe-hydrogenase subunit HybB-like protein